MATAKSKKLLFWLLGIVGVLAVFLVIGKQMGWLGAKEHQTGVEATEAKLKTITSKVEASGKIRPEVEVIISPDVSGEIIELAVKEGDMVSKGDLLLRIKPDIYQAQIDQLRANLLSTKAQLEQNRANLIRSKADYEQKQELYDKGLISEMEFITAKSNYEADKASLKSTEFRVQNAEAQLSKAQKELEQTIIKAPMAGTISQLNVEEGERVVGSIQMTGTEILRVARLEQMEVQVNVNENDIVSVEVGDSTYIDVDSYPDRMFKGVVTEIANSATVSGSGTSEQITNYEVKIRITTPHNQDKRTGESFMQLAGMNDQANKTQKSPSFKPGMSASVEIMTETVDQVVAVPIQAVTVRDFSQLETKSDTTDTAEEDDNVIAKEDLRRVVFKVADGKAVMEEVTTGISDDSHIQIMSGVETGDMIVTGSYRILSRELEDGDAVKIDNDKFKRLMSADE